jgi:hypothetical protein
VRADAQPPRLHDQCSRDAALKAAIICEDLLPGYARTSRPLVKDVLSLGPLVLDTFPPGCVSTADDVALVAVFRASATRLNGTLYGQIIPMTVVETAPVQAHRSTRN